MKDALLGIVFLGIIAFGFYIMQRLDLYIAFSKIGRTGKCRAKELDRGKSFDSKAKKNENV